MKHTLLSKKKMARRENVRSVTHTEEEVEAALKSDFCKPKVYSSIPNTKNIEPRKESRVVCKDDLIVVKECSVCARKIKKVKKAFLCNCKEFLFCCYDCKQTSQHRCKERQNWRVKLEDVAHVANMEIIEDDEEKETYVEAMRTYQGKSLEDIEKMVKSKNDTFMAYLIGSSYSARMAMGKDISDKKRPLPCFMPCKDLKKSPVETDEIAMKWFEIAAKGGHGDAMISLAHKILDNNGLKTDSRLGIYWFTQAIERGLELEPESLELFEAKAMLVGDISASLESFKNIPRGAPVLLHGPNLGTLLLATRFKKLEEWKGKTFSGGIFYPFRKFSTLAIIFKCCKITPTFVVGHPGTSGSSRLCVESERSINNIEFRQGEKGTTENGGLLDAEQVNKVDKDAWYTRERSQYKVSCLHTGQFESCPAGSCHKCQDNAVKRTAAVAEGLYSISLTETVPAYGYGARYLTVAEGDMILETFKGYSQPDICCVLQCLMSNPADLHPLFIAEDPNLFWPIIWYYGSVYSALLSCCGVNIVKKLYGKLSQYRSNKISSGSPTIPSNLSAFPSYAVGETRKACGNESCPTLDHGEKFLKCAACKVRYYCAVECQRSDWKKHKSECKSQKTKG